MKRLSLGFLIFLLPLLASAAPQRRVAFTFDDLPGVSAGDCAALPAVNRNLLASIRRNAIPAVGFINDGRPCGNAAIYKMWRDAGLELGNHTRSHRDFNVTPIEEFKADTLANEKAVPDMRYFRYPFLRTGTDLQKKRAFEKFLADEGYTIAPVTIDNDEYIYAVAYMKAMGRGDRELAGRVARDYLRYMDSIFAFYERLSRDTLGYELPQVLLLHANRLNSEYLDELVLLVKKRGYAIVSLEEALRDPAYARTDGYVGRRGLSWLQRWALDAAKPAPSQPDAPRWLSDVR